MTYIANESGLQSGAPVELYEFQSGSTAWRYTSADENITYNGVSYVSTPLQRSNLDETAELNRLNLKITLQRNNPVADLFRIHPPGDVVSVVIKRLHRTDVDAQAVVVWTGRVLGCEWNMGEVTLSTETIYTAIRRNGLRRLYQRQCPHVLYGTACTLSKDDFKATDAITSLAGRVLQIAAAAFQVDGYYAGGFLKWIDGATGVSDHRMIIKHVGSEITMISSVPGMFAGHVVDLYPGCDHTITTCNSRFNNKNNYGGFTGFPDKNPFQLSTLY